MRLNTYGIRNSITFSRHMLQRCSPTIHQNHVSKLYSHEEAHPRSFLNSFIHIVRQNWLSVYLSSHLAQLLHSCLRDKGGCAHFFCLVCLQVEVGTRLNSPFIGWLAVKFPISFWRYGSMYKLSRSLTCLQLWKILQIGLTSQLKWFSDRSQGLSMKLACKQKVAVK